MTKLNRIDKTAIKRHSHVFKTLTKTGKKRRDAILLGSPPSFYSTLKRLCKLLLNGAIQLSNRDRKKFSPKMRTIVRSIISSKNVKGHAVQHGNGIASVLKIVLPIVRGIIGI